MVRRLPADARGRHCGRPSPGCLSRADRWSCTTPRTKFDPRTVLETAEREKVGLMTMVGDRLRRTLGRRTRHGAATTCRRCSPSVPGGRRPTRNINGRCWSHIPQITIINGFGSSETGNVGFGHTQRQTDTADTFQLRPGASGARRGLHAGSWSQVKMRSAGWPATAGSRWATSTTRTPTAEDLPRGRRAAGGGLRRPAALDSDGTPAAVRPGFAGGQHRRGESIRRRGRGGLAGPPRRSPMRWWSGRPSERWGEEIVAIVCAARRRPLRPEVVA